MKYFIAFLAIFCFVTPRNSSAQNVTHYDSVSLQPPLISPTFSPGVVDTQYLFGNPDGNCAHFTNGGSAGARFRVGSEEITMQKGQPIHVYWRLPALSSTDSNLGRVHLTRLTDDFSQYGDTVFYVYEPQNLNEGMATIIVPDSGYNSIGLEMAADSNGNSFYVDAVVLVQSGTAAVIGQPGNSAPLLTSYPNPIEHNSRATVHITSSMTGVGILAISDVLGQEVQRISVGALNPAGEDAAVTLDHSGVFFARLLVDGTPIGNPLKLIAE